MDYPVYTIEESLFPRALSEIPDPPTSLTARGTLPPAEHKKLVVVGARHYSTYGKQAVEHLLSGLRGYPITIISGLAIGIDGLAHRAALDNNLATIAIPGSGLNDTVLYPRRHKSLAYEILRAGGALISEYDPDFHATGWSFVRRNRIMAGMADAVLIIEAEKKSGTLVTSRLATDYNRDVLAVPGSIFSRTSEGPHLLLSLGATPITTSEDILNALHLDTNAVSPQQTSADLSPAEQRVLALLSEPRTRDTLIAMLNIQTAEANALIMLMELRGYITSQNNVYIRK